MPKNLVIVESPAKAKTIEKYLGADFRVLSSVGHIRKDVKVDPAQDFAVTYEIDPDHHKIVKELQKAVKAANVVWLATDEDREGESISWHLLEVLKLPAHTHRITFHEITPAALATAIQHPRQIDLAMVASQQARQSLDMLVGYDLSGVVRRKVPGAKSAGRVQSPAVKLIVEKEREIEKFAKKSSFKLTGHFQKDHTEFTATLEKVAPASEAAAQTILESLQSTDFIVDQVTQTKTNKANPTPLTTAALQIEANNKLGFATGTTMRAAQALYQAGLITYHRTDSLNLSNQALQQIATYIKKSFGDQYLHQRHFKTKSNSAQEAHEAIRPTNINTTNAGKNDFERKLYQLIWSRTLATQMTNAVLGKTTVNIIATTHTSPLTFVAKGEVISFDGFLKVYGKSKDSELPKLTQGDHVTAQNIIARQNFASPPARYTEGSLVKKLEELGIGRPSTYAGIISAIQSRGYIRKGEGEGRERNLIELKLDFATTPPAITHYKVTEKSGATKGKLLPTPVGELIADFLSEHFQSIVDYGFTADIEQKLDQIAEQKLDRVKMLKAFYQPFSQAVTAAQDSARYNGAIQLGQDPKTQQPIYAKIGKNGAFIQLGDNEKDSGQKPRFAPLPPHSTVKTVTLKQALAQLALPELPRSLGKAPDGTELIVSNGPFGPYLKAGKHNIPLKNQDPYHIDFATAQPFYQAKLNSIIADWGEIMIINGAYGPYVKGPGRRNHCKVPKDQDPTKLSLAAAQQLLEEKPKTRRRASRKRSTIPKKTTRKTKKA